MKAGTLEAITSLTDLKPFDRVVVADEANWSMFERDEVAVLFAVAVRFKLLLLLKLPNCLPEFESVALFKPADADVE